MVGNIATIDNAIDVLKSKGLVIKNRERAARLFVLQNQIF